MYTSEWDTVPPHKSARWTSEIARGDKTWIACGALFFAANRFRAPLSLSFSLSCASLSLSDAAISLSQLRGRKSLLAVPSLPRSLMGVLTRHGMGGRTDGRVRRREGRGTRNCKHPTTAQPRARFAGANPIDRLPDRCGSFFKKTDRVRWEWKRGKREKEGRRKCD